MGLFKLIIKRGVHWETPPIYKIILKFYLHSQSQHSSLNPSAIPSTASSMAYAATAVAMNPPTTLAAFIASGHHPPLIDWSSSLEISLNFSIFYFFLI